MIGNQMVNLVKGLGLVILMLMVVPVDHLMDITKKQDILNGTLVKVRVYQLRQVKEVCVNTEQQKTIGLV